jgi:hypothetical protein
VDRAANFFAHNPYFHATCVKSSSAAADTECGSGSGIHSNRRIGFFGTQAMMEKAERRFEKRLRYSWPVWFAENFNDILTQGQMIDISSTGAAFSCYADKCPWPGQHITARFSVPRYGEENSFDLENFIRDGHICRVDGISPFVRRVAGARSG